LFLAGTCTSRREDNAEEVAIRAGNRENDSYLSNLSNSGEGGDVKRTLAILGIMLLGMAGDLSAQNAPTKKPASAGGKGTSASAAAAARGKGIFDKSCGVCHYADSDAKKIGPGLKGLSKRGTFSVNNNKVTDENLRTWIENGDSLMPPFKESLEAAQIKDLIAYVKTL
jgi:mono/diheme cytochrome c family protein